MWQTVRITFLKALATRNARCLRVLLLAGAALVCAADATEAEQAQDVLARNLLRTCVTALGVIHLDHPDRLQALGDQSCTAVPDLDLPGLSAHRFPLSRITLHPEAQEAFQVQVTSPTGKVFVFPDRLTPRPTAAAELRPVWLPWSISLLTLGLLTALLARIPPLFRLGWVGALLLGSSFLWTVSTHPPTNDGPAQWIGLISWNTWVWLLLSGTTGTLRRVLWSGTESWFQALGAGLVWAALPSPLLSIFVFGTFYSAEGRVGWSSLLAAMLISAAVLLASLIGAHVFLWRRTLNRGGGNPS
jgi:hypothetical protein